MNVKPNLRHAVLTSAIAGLTFAVPAAQGLAGKLILSSQKTGLTGSLFVILCSLLWAKRTKTVSTFPASYSWKAFCSLALIIVLCLLFFNIQNGPVSRITGQARPPVEVINIILLLPVAEEFIFRGIIWSLIEGFPGNRRRTVAALAATSLLFGVEHIGYWVQASWLLTPDALIHAASMVAAGICFGGIRLVSRSLAVPMAVHMLANGLILLTQ